MPSLIPLQFFLSCTSFCNLSTTAYLEWSPGQCVSRRVFSISYCATDSIICTFLGFSDPFLCYLLCNQICIHWIILYYTKFILMFIQHKLTARSLSFSHSLFISPYFSIWLSIISSLPWFHHKQSPLTPPLPLFPLGQQYNSSVVSIIIIQSPPLNRKLSTQALILAGQLTLSLLSSPPLSSPHLLSPFLLTHFPHKLY